MAYELCLLLIRDIPNVYPPPSPSRGPTSRRATANQITAGFLQKLAGPGPVGLEPMDRTRNHFFTFRDTTHRPTGTQGDGARVCDTALRESRQVTVTMTNMWREACAGPASLHVCVVCSCVCAASARGAPGSQLIPTCVVVYDVSHVRSRLALACSAPLSATDGVPSQHL